MTDHTDLRRLAMAATPGPWVIETSRATTGIDRWLSTMHPSPIFELIPLLGYEKEHDQNAAYIAAADPQTVIGLLDRIEALEATLKPFAQASLAIRVAERMTGRQFDDNDAFRSGVAWQKDGVTHTITYGHFRAARATLSGKEGQL